MSRIYGETIDKRIRNIILLVLFSICFFCCKKEEPPQICKTCTITVESNEPSSPPITYIESQTKYCNHEYDTIKQGLIYWKKWSNNGGVNWGNIKKTRECI